jgi:hypothetical protein
MPTKIDKANVVTSIPGYDENENYRHSAIPVYLDEWFHGDFDTVREQNLPNAITTKNLEEYTQSFPDYRINSVIEISFDTSDNQTVSNPNVTMTDTDDTEPTGSGSPGGVSPITLEGASDEEPNPFRNEYDYDGSQNYLNATVKGYKADPQVVGPIGDNDIEGVRASLILGGSDPYVEKAKSRGEFYDILRTEDDLISAATVAHYFATPSFYSFLDFIFMADGTKLVRVWDASVYPAHALYVGEEKKDQNPFREGTEWTKDGSLSEQNAFLHFADEATIPGYTPFDRSEVFRYEENFDALFAQGEHPIMDWEDDGSEITADTVRSALPDPLFPSAL